MENKHCIALLSPDGKLIFGEDVLQHIKNAKYSWNYNPYMNNDIILADILTRGKGIDKICPAHLKEEFARVRKKLKAHYISIYESRVSLDKICAFDLIPEKALYDFCSVKSQIVDYIIETYEKPNDYDFLLRTEKMINNIARQNIKIDQKYIREHLFNDKIYRFSKTMKNRACQVHYKQFGAKTGRLTIKNSGIPILNLNEGLRHVLTPNNDVYVDLDYNSMDLRVILGLLGKNQPTEDIHEWNMKNVFHRDLNRSRAKELIFSWIYNPKYENNEMEKTYRRDYLVDKYWKNGRIVNGFGEEYECDRDHAFSYLIQSTAARLFKEQAIKVHEFLNGYKSNVSFLVHDSIVLDMDKKEKSLIPEIIDIFKSTELGNFMVKVGIGKNFGEIRNVGRY